MTSFGGTFKGKRVLVTGHTGFKGGWLVHWLERLGASVYGFSSDIPSEPSLFVSSLVTSRLVSNGDFRGDIRDRRLLEKAFEVSDPDFVFHLAAQPIVRRSIIDPLDTFGVNILGTATVLEILRATQKEIVAVIITSDKVYHNKEWCWGYREIDMIGGKDPYSASKASAELVIKSYVDTYLRDARPNIRLGIGRAGNVIGGGDWAADRLVPDLVRAKTSGNRMCLRHPAATRPWQHVLEPLSGYLQLAVALEKGEAVTFEAFNFGPPPSQNKTVAELVKGLQRHWNSLDVNIPGGEAEAEVIEAGLLRLNCDKAQSLLNWNPRLEWEDTIQLTADWYTHWESVSKSTTWGNEAIAKYCESQIQFFETKVV